MKYSPTVNARFWVTYLFLPFVLCLSGCGANPNKEFRPEGWVETAPYVWTTSRRHMDIEITRLTRAFMDSSVSVDFKIKNTNDSPMTIEVESMTLYLKGDSINGRVFYSNSEGRYRLDFGSQVKAGEQIIPSSGSLNLIGYFSSIPTSIPNKMKILLKIKTHLGEEEISIPMVDCAEGCSKLATPEKA
jgi:hypothetical protein